MADVFVSYKAEDRPRVRPLVEALEAEGLSVWWDERVGGGEAWRETIAEHLDAAKCVIVVWSKRSVGPEGRFVRDEATRAQRRGTYVPVTIERVDPPLGFGEMQALSLNGWKGDRSDPRYHAVSGCVHSILGRKAPPVLAQAPGTRVSRRGLLAGGAVAVAAAAAGGWLLLRPAGARANTIAVLPFANLSGDPAQTYFSDGMAEEVRSALAALGGFAVVARTSSEMLRNVDAVTAARRLKVANVMTGSVRRSPSIVRVNAQLIDGENGLERWSQSFDRPLGDVLLIQTDIAASVARALSIELGSTAQAVLSLGGTKNPQAQDLLLQATARRGDDSDAGVRHTIALLERATELDPNYAEAHARKAQLLSLWAGTHAPNINERDRAQAQALQSVRRAIAIAPGMPLGYSVVGNIYHIDLQMKRALGALRRAEELPGTDTLILLNYAIALSRARRQDEAELMVERAISLDPLNPIPRALQSLILFYGHRYADALAAARDALNIAPQNNLAKGIAGWSLLLLGRLDEALAALQRMPADHYRRHVGEAAIAARTGRKEEALRAIAAIDKRYGDSAPYQHAQIYAQLGLVDQAFEALDAAWAKRDPGLSSVQVDPFLDPLRNDPRLAAITARVFG